MAKTFAKRVSKKKRDYKDIAAHLDQSILHMNDQKLLQGARLDDIELAKIEVRKQVRTKFNDDSIRELAENIKENGLIQPLVVHREGNKYVLICGERRFRAMSTLEDMKFAPCFILEDKSDEELMAIQFSENSAREQLHFIDQADSIYGYKKLTGASERKIQAALGISKSEVHRCLKIAKLPKSIKEAAKEHNTEKYVLLEWGDLEKGNLRNNLRNKIVDGTIKKRLQLKRAINAAGGGVVKKKKTTKKIPSTDIIKLVNAKTKELDMDKKTQAMLKKLLKEAQKDLNT
jgi:ParB family chromosome partitioning protein